MNKSSFCAGSFLLCTLFAQLAYAETNTYTCTSNASGAADFTMNCVFVPSGTVPPAGGSEAVLMLAPNQVGARQTQLGNYATGCASSPGAASSLMPNHSCLMFDDHWDGTGTSSPTSGLDLKHWSGGLVMCNNGSAQNCTLLYDGTMGSNIPLPLTAWCDFGQCFHNVLYPYPYGMGSSTPIAGIDVSTFHPLERAQDGSLAFGAKYYFSQLQGTNNGTSGFCHNTSCQYLNWVSSAINLGAVNQSTFTMTYPNGLIPVAGGMIQWRMKLDDGVLNGAYGGMQCSAVGGPWPDTGTNDSNANFEFGYLSVASGGGAPHAGSFGNGQNDTAVQTSAAHAGNNYVTTGSINPDGSVPAGGQGSGDSRNWHVYGLEWVKSPAPGAPSGSGQWFYYVDGVSQPVIGLQTSQGGYNGIPHAETRVPTIGWQCSLSQNITNASFNSFHSAWNPNNPNPGPFYMWVSDVQIWKKPGSVKKSVRR